MQNLLQNKQTNKQQLLAIVRLHIFLIWQWRLWISLFYTYFCNGENGYPCFTPSLVYAFWEVIIQNAQWFADMN